MSTYNLAAYPADLGDSAKIVLQKMTGQTVALETLVHAGWHVAGFAASQAFPDKGLGANSGAATAYAAAFPLPDTVMVQHLQSMCDGQMHAVGFTLPWASIALTVLQLLAKILAGQ